MTGAFSLVNGRWIPARRFKHPDEYTLWERIAFWRDIPIVSQEQANREAGWLVSTKQEVSDK